MESEKTENQTDFQTLNLPNGETYAYREAGNSSKVLILLHCFGGSSLVYKNLFPKFTDSFRVVAFDLRGHGNSSYHTKIAKIEDVVDDVKEAVDLLGLTKFSILGWSFSGAVALKFAADYFDYVENVILLNSIGAKGLPTFRVDAQGVQISERVQTEEETLKTPFVMLLFDIIGTQDQVQVKQLMSSALYNGKGGHDTEMAKIHGDTFLLVKCIGHLQNAMNKFNISHENNGVVEGTGDIKHVQAPVLILHGKKDVVVPYTEAEDLKELLQDKATLKLFDEGGHAVINDYPEEIIKSIREFLSL